MSTAAPYNWKEHAASRIKEAGMQDSSQVDKEALEKAFMEQAYISVANKCGPLMKEPYRLNFEIIKKNDDNTKLAGIFAFRIGKALLYVPVFFINSTVKGSDLLYRHNVKRFVPLTEGWVKLLMETEMNPEGKGIDRKELSKYPPNINLYNIAYPPDSFAEGGRAKYASEHEEAIAALEPYLKAAFEPGSLLCKYLEEDGGPQAFNKLAEWIGESDDFADLSNLLLPLDKMMDNEFVAKVASVGLPKKAAAQGEPDLQVFTDIPDDKILEPELLGDLMKQGFAISDKRAQDVVTPVYHPDDIGLETASLPGVYEVLTSSGEFVKAFIAFKSDCAVWREGGNEPKLCSESYSDRDNGGDGGYNLDYRGRIPSRSCKPQCGVILSDKHIFHSAYNKQLVGKLVRILDDNASEEFLKEKPSTGKAYLLYDPSKQELSRPFYVLSSRERDGVTVLKVNDYLHGNDYANVIVINPDATDSCSQGVYGPSVRFIEVAYEWKKSYGDDKCLRAKEADHLILDGDALDAWVFASGNLLKEPFEKFAMTYSARDGKFQLSGRPMNNTPWMSKKASVIFLTTNLGTRYADAKRIVETAQEKGRAEFRTQPPASVEKRAGYMRLTESMDFDTPDFRNEWGVLEEPYREKSIGIDYHQKVNTPPNPRVGDARDPSHGWGGNKDYFPDKKASQRPEDHLSTPILLSASPEKISELGKSYQLPHLFEHGVLANLLSTYDSSSQIEKYMGDLEVALDRIGRILFLFYWKPADYEALYGSDDVANLESELISNFRSFGDMILNLHRRNKETTMDLSKDNSSLS